MKKICGVLLGLSFFLSSCRQEADVASYNVSKAKHPMEKLMWEMAYQSFKYWSKKR